MTLDVLLEILKYIGIAALTFGTSYIGQKLKTGNEKLEHLLSSINSLKTDVAVIQHDVNTILTDVENMKRDNSQIKEKTFDLDKRLSLIESWKQHAYRETA